MDAVPVEVPLPGDKLIDRDVVDLAHFLDRNPAVTHRSDHRRLPSHGPSLSRSGQLRNIAEQVVGAKLHHSRKPLQCSLQSRDLLRMAYLSIGLTDKVSIGLSI